MTSPLAVHTEKLRRTFQGRAAVDDLTIDTQQGEILGLLGHNGAGKTTMVRLLGGVLARDSGYVSVLGHDPATDAVALRQKTGVVTESPAIDDRFSAYENLVFFGQMFSVPEQAIKERIAHLLRFFELDDSAHRRASTFSKGMRQKLAIARALLHRPEILYLDEPTSGLDPIASKQLRALLREQSQQDGCTMLFCTHRLVEAAELCDRVAIMAHGKLVALGTPYELSRSIKPKKLDVIVETEIQYAEKAANLCRETFSPHVVQHPHQHQQVETLRIVQLPRERICEIAPIFLREQIPLLALIPQEPTLEDLYVSLQETTGAA